MAIFIILIAYYCVRNTTQDLIYAITGRVPPSFVREQNRIARREARRPITADRGHQKFFRNAYNDAWETAEEKRARRSAKKAQKRHKKWDAEDAQLGDVPTPVTTNARPEERTDLPAPEVPSTSLDRITAPTSVVHDNDTYVVGAGIKEESLYHRYAMRRRNGGQPMTTVAVADELDTTVTEAEKLQTRWASRYEKETAAGTEQPPPHLLDYQKHSKCRDCGGAVEIEKDPERLGWIVRTTHTRDDCPQNTQRPTPREQHDQQVQQLADQVTPNTREGNRPGGSTPPMKENELTINAETTGLQSGLNYNAAMAEKCEEGATSVEQSIAALENGEVGAAVTGPMQRGRELLESAQACFQEAHDELQSHMTVQEAYGANPDAGNKQFVTAE